MPSYLPGQKKQTDTTYARIIERKEKEKALICAMEAPAESPMEMQPRVDKIIPGLYRLSEGSSVVAEEVPDIPMTDGTQTKA